MFNCSKIVMLRKCYFFLMAEIIKKNIFLSFNVIDLPVLQGCQGTGMSTVYLHASARPSKNYSGVFGMVLQPILK